MKRAWVILGLTIGVVLSAPARGEEVSQAERDANALAEAVLPIARDLLSKFGSFYPFGGALTPADETDVISAGDKGTTEDEIIANLTAGYKVAAAEGRYKAVAFVGDVTVRREAGDEPETAILIQLEHRDGYCVDSFYPYVLEVSSTDELGSISVSYGEPWSKARRGTVFTDCKADAAPTVEDLQEMLDELKNGAE